MTEIEQCPVMSCQKKYIKHHRKEHFMKEHPELWKFMEQAREAMLKTVNKILDHPKVVHVDDVRRELSKLQEEEAKK